MGNSIGDYIHYHAMNYYIHGNTLRGFDKAYDVHDWVARRKNIVDKMPKISNKKGNYVKKVEQMLQGYYDKWEKDGIEKGGAAKVYQALENYLTETLKGDTTKLDEILKNMMLNKGKVEYAENPLKRIGSDKDKRIMESTAQITRTLYDKVIEDFGNIYRLVGRGQEPLRSDVDLEQINEWFEAAKKDMRQLSANVSDNYLTYLSNDGKLTRQKISNFKRSKGHELNEGDRAIYWGKSDNAKRETFKDLQKNLNKIADAYSLGFNLNVVQGISFEYFIATALGVACQESVTSVTKGLEEAINTASSKMVGGEKSHSKMIVLKNAYVDIDAIGKEFGNKKYQNARIDKEFGRAIVHADIKTEGKTDISVTLPNNEPLNISAKSYHTGKIGTQQDISLVSKTNWYFYLQDMPFDVVNHFFNTTTTYRGKQRQDKYRIVAAKEYMKLVILQKALMGTTQKEKGKKIDYLAINNRGSVKFIPMKDILEEAKDNNCSNITITGLSTLNNADKIPNFNVYVGDKKISDQQSAKSRITNLVAKTMSTKISVHYKYK